MLEKTNRNLLRNLIEDITTKNLEDSYIFIEFCRKFINRLDNNQIYSDYMVTLC
ncbi:hypothetical protein QE441_002932 [Chryseobacterium sp. SORGH_AS909]|uniref:Uncharacterized protein n=1 Tax=Chryseobacterium camelliae TaxID=1265445 RepID=A0ABU0THY9_9FLAO|nr:hypothetical protein [Chryseobacterium camelliae]MDQ1099791.1 hypothetical protein [Chryseobacterium sp. SORGH_AS_1048]MDR6087138.1 hypothetical protein [Chryseobacterium sp. SORGH_AS_0909]MDR6131511.1 hypothetical protein [Chryseobacterium sp. SORGH_AS_1175]MDT3406346.1 hypothetical protein [Pseudacidovorax intermedius]